MKLFYTMDNIGKAKYTVNTYNGISTHKDGSPFFGIAIFKNKKLYNSHIKELKKDNVWWSVYHWVRWLTLYVNLIDRQFRTRFI